MPKLAVVSQATTTSSFTTNSTSNNQSNQDTITVIVCPKQSSSSSNNTTTTATSITSSLRLNESEKQQAYPYYEKLCKIYGFALEVEVLFARRCSGNGGGGNSSSGGGGRRVKKGGGGPIISHHIVAASGDDNTATVGTNEKLYHHSERLIIRPPCFASKPNSNRNNSSKSKSSSNSRSNNNNNNNNNNNKSSSNNKRSKQQSQLRPPFRTGDILTTIDGIHNPTFDMVYALMIRGDKLLLEIVRPTNKSGGGRSATTSALRSATANATANATTTATTVAVVNTTSSLQMSTQEEQQRQQLTQQQQAKTIAATSATTASTVTTNTPASTTTNTLTSKQQQQQQRKATIKKSNAKKNNNDNNGLNIHSPNYITKAISKLQTNIQEYNRQQQLEEDAMYTGENRMLLDFSLADGGGGGGGADDDGGMEEEDGMEDEDDVEESVRSEGNGAQHHSVETSSPTTTDLTTATSSSYSPEEETVNPINSQQIKSATTTNKKSKLWNRMHGGVCNGSSPGVDNDEDGDSSSVPSSSSSSSSSSDSSSTSGSSSSSSSSSSSNDSCIAKASTQPPQTITTATNNSMSTPPKVGNHTRFTSVSESASITTVGVAEPNPKRARSSSSDNGGKTYPTYSSTNRSEAAVPASKAPTSLARLWPDPSDCVKALTMWQPPTAVVSKRNRVEFYGAVGTCDLESDKLSPNHPLNAVKYDEYRNAAEMMKGMVGPLMNEGLASINNDYHSSSKQHNGRWNHDTHRLIITKISRVTPIFEKKSSFIGEHIKIYEIQFSLKGETIIPPSLLSELYCLHYDRWKSCKFGLVGHDFPTTLTFRKHSESNSILKLFVCVDETLTGNSSEDGKTGWLSKQDFRALFDPHKFGVPHPNAVMTIMSVGSTTNIFRQYEAIASVGHLKRESVIFLCVFISYYQVHVTNSQTHICYSAHSRGIVLEIYQQSSQIDIICTTSTIATDRHMDEFAEESQSMPALIYIQSPKWTLQEQFLPNPRPTWCKYQLSK
jgi:hypothetical protein